MSILSSKILTLCPRCNNYPLLFLNKDQPKSILIKDDLNNPSEITFSVNKYVDGKKTNLWDKIVDFKLLWCVEWDMWFEITVDIDESTETVKNVYDNRQHYIDVMKSSKGDNAVNTIIELIESIVNNQ